MTKRLSISAYFSWQQTIFKPNENVTTHTPVTTEVFRTLKLNLKKIVFIDNDMEVGKLRKQSENGIEPVKIKALIYFLFQKTVAPTALIHLVQLVM